MKKLMFSIVAISCLIAAKSTSLNDEQIKNIKTELEKNKIEVNRLLSKKEENVKHLELIREDQNRALLLYEERKKIIKEQEIKELNVKQNLENKLAMAKSELENKKNKFKEEMQAKMDKDEVYSDKKRIQNQDDDYHQYNIQAKHIDNAKAQMQLEKQGQSIDLDLERKSIVNQGFKENQNVDIEFNKAKLNRANDYITEDINQKKAESDVKQSDADAIRNLSEGGKNLLTGIGKVADKLTSK